MRRSVAEGRTYPLTTTGRWEDVATVPAIWATNKRRGGRMCGRFLLQGTKTNERRALQAEVLRALLDLP
jgi:hypothetical protein